MRSRFFSAAAILCATLFPACSAAPPAPLPPVVANAPPPAPAAPLLPSRWVVSGKRNQAVPFAGGMVRLVGGRRLLIASNGVARWQTADLPLPLDELLVAPSASGPRLLGYVGGVLERFDDPLGPATPLLPPGMPVAYTRVMPGLVAVWSSTPATPVRFFSVENGKETKFPTMPDFPLMDVTFEDELHGAALFHLWGVSVTRDGGATWQRPRSKGPSGSVLDVENFNAVDIQNGQLIEDDGAEEPPAPSPPAPEQAPKPAPTPGATIPLDELVGLDPLATAALAGVTAPDGGAWIAWNGFVLHIDLQATAATVVAAIPDIDPKAIPWCDLRRAGSDVWISCRPQAHGSKLATVCRGTIDNGKLTLGPQERPAPLATALRVSPSGGVLALVPPNAGSPAMAVARHPSGDWRIATLKNSWMHESAGALVDGRVAVLENPKPGEEPPRVIMAIPGSSKKKALVPLDLPVLSVAGPIEEDAAHVLHFIAQDKQGLFAVAQPLGGGAARVARVPGAFAARLQAGKGVALTKESVLASTDSGMTWSEIPAPAGVRVMLAKPEALHFFDGDAVTVHRQRAWTPENGAAFAVGEIGALLGDHLRLGWGSQEKNAPPTASLAAPTTPAAAAPQPAPLGKKHALSCKDEGAAAGSLAPHEETLYDLTAAKLPAGMRSEAFVVFPEQALFSTAEGGNPLAQNPLASAVLFIEGAAEPKSEWDQPPYRWFVRFRDPLEVGSRLRTWQGEAPNFDDHASRVWLMHPEPGQNVPRRTRLELGGLSGVATRDGRAIFYATGVFSQPTDDSEGISIDAGALVRLNASGKGEVLRVIVGNSSPPNGPTPAFSREGAVKAGLVGDTRILDDRLVSGNTFLSEAAFGSGPGAPIAGIMANQLFIWFEGKPMSLLARLPDMEMHVPAQLIVGEPSAEGVPLLALDGAFQRFGLVPIPKNNPADPPLLDGVAWKRLPTTPLVPERLPSCDARAPGMTFTLRTEETALRVLFDATASVAASVTYDVRVTEQGACVSRASVYLEAEDGKGPRFVRADLAGRRAEGGAADAPKGGVRKLACAWIDDEKP